MTIESTTAPLIERPLPRRRVTRWLTALAVVAAALSIIHLVAWGNRWYIATQFFGVNDGWEYRFEHMVTVHQTLVNAILFLILATIMQVAARWTARR